MRYLLDTNVVSEMRKIKSGRANARVTEWAESVLPSVLYISVITLQELEIGILGVERRDPSAGVHLRDWLEQRVIPAFSGRVISVDSNVALHSAAFHVPDPRPFRDGLIGATASYHGMTLVTRNTRDFEYLETALLNPWEEQ